MISVSVVCQTAVIYFNGGKIYTPMAPLSPSKKNRLAYEQKLKRNRNLAVLLGGLTAAAATLCRRKYISREKISHFEAHWEGVVG